MLDIKYYQRMRVALEFHRKLLHEMAANPERFEGMNPEELAATREQVKNNLKEFEAEVNKIERDHTGIRRYLPTTMIGYFYTAAALLFILGIIISFYSILDAYYFWGVSQLWVMGASILLEIKKIKIKANGF